MISRSAVVVLRRERGGCAQVWVVTLAVFPASPVSARTSRVSTV